MDRHESRALESLLTREQLLECIEEQRKRTETLNILTSLTDIAIEKDFITMEQLEDAMGRMADESSTIDWMSPGPGDEPEIDLEPEPAGEEGEEGEQARPKTGDGLLTQALDAPSGFTVQGPEKPKPGGFESSMQRNLLAQLAFSGEVDSEICSAALTELAGESLVGKMMLGFRLVFLIGEGPISDVFKGLRPAYEQAFALKLIPKRFFTTEIMVRRFLSRMRLAARLDHPNILKPLDFGETSHYLCYTLCPYVEAVPLWLLIKRHGRISEKMSLAIMRFIARGLAHAHTSGVVHGNLKPANVLVTPRGVVKVVDWGTPRTCALLAAGKLDEEVARLSLISEGMCYLPPELVHGETEVAPACDLYSLGAMFYHLLTGRAPFTGERDEVLEAICQGFPPVPEGAASEGSQELLARMTQRDPAERLGSADELVEKVEDVLKTLS
jgi:hypothetical protein